MPIAALPVPDWSDDDLDHTPIPTSRIVKPELMPGVITTYREIMCEYIQSTYPVKHKIWHSVLSAMKTSLATITQASTRRNRRRPLQMESETNSEKAESSAHDTEKMDKRAIKKATRLVIERATRKAAQVLDRKISTHQLSEEETLQKLQDLHPQHPYKFGLPSDAPILGGLNPTELRSAGLRLAKGASPGPTGTTDTIVRILIDDPVCCESLCHMIMDLINGFLSKEVMRRLTRARLIAIPKANGGVRPVAIGEVLMKLAGLVLVQRFESTLQPLFAPIQQGVLAKAGCEKVVHTLNSLYHEGSCIMSVDIKNAFNAPSRSDLAKGIYGLATLKPFQRFFHAEYSAASELLYYGHNGKHVGTILSTNGVRQGSTLSSVYFCAFLQPVLETLASKYPEIKISAYVDDITLASHNPKELTEAFLDLRELLAEQNLVVANQKYIWFGGIRKESMPLELRDAGVTGEEQAIKILGAFIGDNEIVSQRLLQSLEKHDDIFRRLKRMGPSNVSCKLLSMCVNVRQGYQMRVHNPIASEALADNFDRETERVAEAWFGNLVEDQISILRLPTKKGGLGLTACAPTRGAAYESSRHSVLEQRNNNSARADTLGKPNAPDNRQNASIPPNDETATAAQIHSKTWKRLTSGTSDISKILEKVAYKGNNEWVLSNARLIPPHLFRLAIMPRLGIPHPDLPSHIVCPGCKILLNSDNMIRHVTGCSKCAG